MPMLTSRDNPEIKGITRLISSRRERETTGLFVAEGLRLCLDAVMQGIDVQTAYFSTSMLEKNPEECRRIQEAAPRWVELSDSLSGRLGDTRTPQGAFCLCKKPQNGPLSVKENGRYVLLSSLQDPGNVGTIIRTANALGLDGVVLSADCPDLYSPKLLRSTMGGVFSFPLWVAEDFAANVDWLRGQGVRVLAAALSPQALPLNQTRFEGACGVVIGNEGNGLSRETMARCDGVVTLPMAREGQSLNAAVAAGILMWELCAKGEGLTP